MKPFINNNKINVLYSDPEVLKDSGWSNIRFLHKDHKVVL